MVFKPSTKALMRRLFTTTLVPAVAMTSFSSARRSCARSGLMDCLSVPRPESQVSAPMFWRNGAMAPVSVSLRTTTTLASTLLTPRPTHFHLLT